MSGNASQQSRRRARARTAPPTLAVTLLAALALVGCGGAHHAPVHAATTGHHRKPTPKQVYIYSSLPLQGPLRSQAQAVRAGIAFALKRADNRAGLFQIRYVALDDASRHTHRVDLRQVANNAAKAATNPLAVWYIGELTSSATKISTTILNGALIPQVTTASPYVGLTEAVPGVTVANEPAPYEPSNTKTLLRLMPNDAVQAQAAVLALHQVFDCARVSAIAQHGSRGAGLVTMMATDAKTYKLALVPYTHLTGKAASVNAYLATLQKQPPDCVVIAAQVSHVIVALTNTIHRDYPRAVILGTAGLCTPRWTAAKGLPADDDPELFCTDPILPLVDYPGGKQFAALYKRGHRAGVPNAYTLYGYEAAELGIQTIAKLKAHGNNRTDLLDALFSDIRTIRISSYLGTYSFDYNGDTTLSTYGLDRVALPDRNPVLYHTLKVPAGAGIG